MRLRSHTQAEDHEAALEALGDFGEEAKNMLESYHERLQRQYNTSVRPRKIREKGLVLKTTSQVMRGLSITKFFAKWEGPYIVKEASESGY